MPSPHPRFKTAIYEQIARIGKAASSPARLEVLDLLSQGPRTVEAIASQIGQSVANTSHHLQVLRGTRLVEAEKAGTYVTYRLADPMVVAFVLQLRRLAQARLAEIDRVHQDYLAQRGVLEAVGDGELLRRVKAGAVTVVDVRPRQEFEAGHIPGALSIPLAELKKRLRDLPKDRDVVAYCRGPYCVMALDAVEILRRKGFRAHRLEQGVVEWQARGEQIRTGIGAEARA
jgi:rhodanese-related sulfurtransferase/DNA-binding transcriptional ArsR family regulator